MEREDDSLLHKAIREALTNLIIHTDYMLTGVLKVEKYDNQFVFSNPGSLKIPVVDIYEGGHSKARNPHIQAIFRMIGFGENIGSGFPTILEACKKENWRRPLLSERPDLHLVELTLSMISLISSECETQLLEIYGDDYKEIEKEEQLILATAFSEGIIANNTVQLLLDKNPLEAGKLLYALVAKDMLLSTNKGRWTTYVINKKYTQGVENSRSKTQGVENSRSKTQGVKRQGVEKARSNKKEKIIERIIAFCQEPHTLQEIAQELGFSDRYWMKKNHIDPLLGDVLQMTSVESKNAPTQKYVVISKSL